MARLTLEEIRQYWTEQAVRHGQSPAASWTDQPVIQMEIRQILNHLNDGDRVLDIGCANGYSTIQFASQRRLRITGADYIPEMIAEATARLAHLANLPSDVSFRVGDITNLEEPPDSYDKVIVIRVVINLGAWDRQLKALRECVRVLKPGGKLLLSEATVQGWAKLNRFRNEWSLPDIPEPAFNSYLDEGKVVQALAEQVSGWEIVNFASSYYVGTRVVKPLLIRALGLGIDVANPDMEWNRWFADLPPAGDYGTQKLFVFEKK